jgi:excisionase family DNA binding protein
MSQNTVSPATARLFDACLEMTGGDRAAAAMLALVETMSNPKPLPKAASGDELTVTEAAERLRCAERTVYRLCREGKLPHRRIGVGRGVIRVRAADLDSFAPAVRTLPADISAKRRRYLGV